MSKIKYILAGIFDIIFFLNLTLLLLLLQKKYNIDIKYIQYFLAFPILLFYFGIYPLYNNNRTISEKILNIDARINIPKQIEFEKKNKFFKLFILFNERLIFFIFDLIFINVFRAFFIKEENKKK